MTELLKSPLQSGGDKGAEAVAISSFSVYLLVLCFLVVYKE